MVTAIVVTNAIGENEMPSIIHTKKAKKKKILVQHMYKILQKHLERYSHKPYNQHNLPGE